METWPYCAERRHLGVATTLVGVSGRSLLGVCAFLLRHNRKGQRLLSFFLSVEYFIKAEGGGDFNNTNILSFLVWAL